MLTTALGLAVALPIKRLKEMIGKQKDRLVVIKAVRVMDVAKSAGAGRLCLATEKDL